VPIKRGFAQVALTSWLGMRICVKQRAVRSASANRGRAWNARAKQLTLSSPATRRRGMEPGSPAASRSIFLRPADPWVSHLPAGSRGETVYQLAHRRLHG
jgi:hypothetical protein